jgi:hypothetical protein
MFLYLLSTVLFVILTKFAFAVYTTYEDERKIQEEKDAEYRAFFRAMMNSDNPGEFSDRHGGGPRNTRVVTYRSAELDSP